MTQRRNGSSVLVRRFAGHVRRLRKQHGFTLIQVALMTRLSESYVSLLERCERAPSLDVIEAFARALQVRDPAHLLTKRKEH